jgi:hypothetical protein
MVDSGCSDKTADREDGLLKIRCANRNKGNLLQTIGAPFSAKRSLSSVSSRHRLLPIKPQMILSLNFEVRQAANVLCLS